MGLSFGPDVTADFLERNGLKLLVRSHEVKDAGCAPPPPPPPPPLPPPILSTATASNSSSTPSPASRPPPPHASAASAPARYEVEAGGKLITVFSAPNYCDQMGNKGALLRFDSNLDYEPKQFEAVPHPPVRAMAYAGGMGMFGF